jgi:hypothetical protein
VIVIVIVMIVRAGFTTVVVVVCVRCLMMMVDVPVHARMLGSVTSVTQSPAPCMI